MKNPQYKDIAFVSGIKYYNDILHFDYDIVNVL